MTPAAPSPSDPSQGSLLTPHARTDNPNQQRYPEHMDVCLRVHSRLRGLSLQGLLQTDSLQTEFLMEKRPEAGIIKPFAVCLKVYGRTAEDWIHSFRWRLNLLRGSALKGVEAGQPSCQGMRTVSLLYGFLGPADTR
ncbi:hypothetical protein EYF80_015033 [Liparis tanakae]|uniref:Uncharacterized protein n=1 Tax=Liparis tanakae TaxID=230148 RepID=A0A4Z2IB95_9TELE|nr:hypothetical protein EYF80_015033 [Liparis tanakae]